jgi:competence protein ComEC
MPSLLGKSLTSVLGQLISAVNTCSQLKKAKVSIITLSIFSAVFLLAIGVQTSKSEHANRVTTKANTWQLHLFDVGQGLSVLISREEQALLYDTGAAYPSGFNMVDSVVLPYLQYAGIKQLDKVFLSHSDNDHAGGLTQLVTGIGMRQLITNDNKLANSHQQSLPCYQGMSFHWQHLRISALWPLMPEKTINQSIKKNTGKMIKQGNDDSCVLLISDGKHKVLLTGDITKKVEQQLLLLYPTLTADVLLVPHHGSKTSSSTAFIKQLSPDIALVSAGFLNRWNMPVTSVIERYRQQGIQLINSSEKGQVVLTFADEIKVESYRDDLRPFWFSQ